MKAGNLNECQVEKVESLGKQIQELIDRLDEIIKEGKEQVA